MGAAAASGGYYIACPADAIVALPSTLTGSIGVFGGKVVVRDLMERLGLTTGTVSHGARSLMYSSRQGFTDDERAQLDATLDAIYADFVAKVAQGRGRPVGGDRGHRPGPGVDRDRRPAHRPRRRVGRVAGRTADRPIPRRAPERRTGRRRAPCIRRWPGWVGRGTARTHAPPSAPPCPGSRTSPPSSGSAASTELRMPTITLR